MSVGTIKLIVVAAIIGFMYINPMVSIVIGGLWLSINAILLATDKRGNLASPKTVTQRTSGQTRTALTTLANQGYSALIHTKGLNAIVDARLAGLGEEASAGWRQSKDKCDAITADYAERNKKLQAKYDQRLQDILDSLAAIK